MTNRVPVVAGRNWQRFAWIALPILVACVFWPGLHGGFFFDDFPNLVNNPALAKPARTLQDLLAATFSSPSSELQRPLSVLTFALNVMVWGIDPVPMKITNIAIHAVNSVLAYLLVRRLLSIGPSTGGQSRLIAFFIAGSWAVSPINLTAVLYIVQRMESLAHTFVFGGLLLYLAGRRRQISRIDGGWMLIMAGLVVCTGAGVLAKESAALLPLYAFAIEICVLRFRGPDVRTQRLLLLAFVLCLLLPAVAAVSLLLPPVLQPDAFLGRNFNLVERLLTEPRVVLDYLRWTLMPNLNQLGLYHDDYIISHGIFSPPFTLVAICMLAAMVAAAWAIRRRRPISSLGIIWFLSAHVMTATFLPLELVFEHRNYFASLGVCLAIGDALLSAPSEDRVRRLGGLLALGFLVLCALLTFLRSAEWSSPQRFSASEAAKNPSSPRAQYEFGRQLVIGSNYQADSPLVPEARAVLERAARLPDAGILPEQGLIMLAARTGQPISRAWWESMNRKLVSRPVGPQETAALSALTYCAVERLCDLDRGQMIETFTAALQRGGHPEVLNIYANYAFNLLGDAPLALRLWEDAHRLRPHEVQYRANRAKVLIALGRFREAAEDIDAIAATGRLGQHDALSASLRDRLEIARKNEHSSPTQ